MGRAKDSGELKEPGFGLTREDRQITSIQLTTVREEEKKDAIARGLMSDPDKAINLSEAITLVGTCQDMCPESERITRAYQNSVWDEEKVRAHSSITRFRRLTKCLG